MKYVLLWMIRFTGNICPERGYDALVSIIQPGSQYGLEAIEKYGALKGGALAVWRILRCNPFFKRWI